MRSTILWIHALAGAAWIAACLSVVLAGLALDAGSEEQRNFVSRAMPKIDFLCLGAALLVLITGSVNLALVAIARGFRVSSQFGLILGLKVMLFIGMTVALLGAVRTSRGLRNSPGDRREDAMSRAISPMLGAHGAIAAMGGIAMLLGLWLMGS